MLQDLFSERTVAYWQARANLEPSATVFDEDRLSKLPNKDFIAEAAEFFGEGELEALYPIGRDGIIAAIKAKQQAKTEVGHAITIKANVTGKAAGGGEGLDK